jgi:hypothetical protein
MTSCTETLGLDQEIIKHLIGVASERPTIGLCVRVGKVGGIIRDIECTIPVGKPSVVKIFEDGRIGFATSGRTYTTQNSDHGQAFMRWLKSANKKKVDYGQPTGCIFECPQ